MAREPVAISTPKGRRVCELYALHGYSKADAYRIGGRVQMPKDPEKRAVRMASTKNQSWEFFQKREVIEYVHMLLDAARAEDCMKAGRAVRQLEDAIQAAMEAENWTAVSQLMDKKFKVMGLMRERVIVSPEGALDDESLIDELARGDPKMKEVLRRAVLPKDTFADGDTEH